MRTSQKKSHILSMVLGVMVGIGNNVQSMENAQNPKAKISPCDKIWRNSFNTLSFDKNEENYKIFEEEDKPNEYCVETQCDFPNQNGRTDQPIKASILFRFFSKKYDVETMKTILNHSDIYLSVKQPKEQSKSLFQMVKDTINIANTDPEPIFTAKTTITLSLDKLCKKLQNQQHNNNNPNRSSPEKEVKLNEKIKQLKKEKLLLAGQVNELQNQQSDNISNNPLEEDSGNQIPKETTKPLPWYKGQTAKRIGLVNLLIGTMWLGDKVGFSSVIAQTCASFKSQLPSINLSFFPFSK